MGRRRDGRIDPGMIRPPAKAPGCVPRKISLPEGITKTRGQPGVLRTSRWCLDPAEAPRVSGNVPAWRSRNSSAHRVRVDASVSHPRRGKPHFLLLQLPQPRIRRRLRGFGPTRGRTGVFFDDRNDKARIRSNPWIQVFGGCRTFRFGRNKRSDRIEWLREIQFHSILRDAELDAPVRPSGGVR